MMSPPKSGLSSDALMQAAVNLSQLGNEMQDIAATKRADVVAMT